MSSANRCAQVWLWLVVGNNDLDRSVTVYNKAVDPAIVRGAQVFVGGTLQADWDHAFDALGVPVPPHSYISRRSTRMCCRPASRSSLIRFSVDVVWKRFRAVALDPMAMNIFFCSTLDECWMYRDRHAVGFTATTQLINPIGQCPRLDDAVTFKN